MQNTPATPTGDLDRRPGKIRILLPIVLSVLALAVFLALFWHDGRPGKKGHSRRTHTAHDANRSPVGGQDGELEDIGNPHVTDGKGGSPVGGGDARPRSGKDEGGWWYREEGKGRQDGEDGWWAPEKDK